MIGRSYTCYAHLDAAKGMACLHEMSIEYGRFGSYSKTSNGVPNRSDRSSQALKSTLNLIILLCRLLGEGRGEGKRIRGEKGVVLP